MAHLENRVGELYENTYGTKFVIVKYVNNKEVYIRFLDDFNSTKECSKHFGFSDGYVSMLCRHKRTNKKYFFEYVGSSGK